MKLDSRIEKESLICTPFTNTQIKLHEKGYFTDDICKFASLKSCVYGELAKLDINLHRPYGCNKASGEDSESYSFYIPESRLLNQVEPIEDDIILDILLSKLEVISSDRVVIYDKSDDMVYDSDNSNALSFYEYWKLLDEKVYRFVDIKRDGKRSIFIFMS